MKLVVDVGNTTIGLGFYQEDNLFDKKIIINTDVEKLEDEYYASIEFLCRQKDINFDEVTSILFSSVVPLLNAPLKNVLSSLFKNAELINLVPSKEYIDMDIDNPKDVGGDLVADLVGGKEKYGYPLLITDLGTATKLLLIDKDGKFVSALIMPGLKVSSDSLFKKAALLPEVEIANPTTLVDSKNTIDCIKHGIIFGHVESIVGLARRYEEEVGYKLKKVITGGASKIIFDLLPEEYILDNNLTLDGELIILNQELNRGGRKNG